MNTKSLSPDLVSDPRLWRLALAIDTKKLHVLAHSFVDDSTFISCSIPLQTNNENRLAPIEDAIYNNRLLLQDFDRIDIIIRSDNYSIIPSDISDDDVITGLFLHEHPAFNGEIFTNRASSVGVVLVTGIESNLFGFLQRTFFNLRIMNWMYPLCSYFGEKSRAGNNRKMYAHFRDGFIDITAFHHGKLLLANSFAYRDPMDAVYFIMATRESLQFDRRLDPVFLVGDHDIRDAILPTLREYIALVMPVLFPSSMSAVLQNDANKSPFPLILAPLCE